MEKELEDIIRGAHKSQSQVAEKVESSLTTAISTSPKQAWSPNPRENSTETAYSNTNSNTTAVSLAMSPITALCSSQGNSSKTPVTARSVVTPRLRSVKRPSLNSASPKPWSIASQYLLKPTTTPLLTARSTPKTDHSLALSVTPENPSNQKKDEVSDKTAREPRVHERTLGALCSGTAFGKSKPAVLDRPMVGSESYRTEKIKRETATPETVESAVKSKARSPSTGSKSRLNISSIKSTVTADCSTKTASSTKKLNLKKKKSRSTRKGSKKSIKGVKSARKHLKRSRMPKTPPNRHPSEVLVDPSFTPLTSKKQKSHTAVPRALFKNKEPLQKSSNSSKKSVSFRSSSSSKQKGNSNSQSKKSQKVLKSKKRRDPTRTNATPVSRSVPQHTIRDIMLDCPARNESVLMSATSSDGAFKVILQVKLKIAEGGKQEPMNMKKVSVADKEVFNK